MLGERPVQIIIYSFEIKKTEHIPVVCITHKFSIQFCILFVRHDEDYWGLNFRIILLHVSLICICVEQVAARALVLLAQHLRAAGAFL